VDIGEGWAILIIAAIVVGVIFGSTATRGIRNHSNNLGHDLWGHGWVTKSGSWHPHVWSSCSSRCIVD